MVRLVFFVAAIHFAILYGPTPAFAQDADFASSSPNEHISGWVETSLGVGVESLFRQGSTLDDPQIDDLARRDDAYVAVAGQLLVQKEVQPWVILAASGEARQARFLAGAGDEQTEGIFDLSLARRFGRSRESLAKIGASSRFRSSSQRLDRIYSSIQVDLGKGSSFQAKPYLTHILATQNSASSKGNGVDLFLVHKLDAVLKLKIEGRRYKEVASNQRAHRATGTIGARLDFFPSRKAEVRFVVRQIDRKRQIIDVQTHDTLLSTDERQQRVEAIGIIRFHPIYRIRASIGYRHIDRNEPLPASSSLQLGLSVRAQI